MDCPSTRNRDLFFRAIDLMQCLFSPEQAPRFSSELIPEYALPEFMHDLETCGKDEEMILASNARAVFDTTIRRKMPTLWLVKTRHPVFVLYAALCASINKSVKTAHLFLGETDFPRLTKLGAKLVRAPLHIVSMEEHASLSTALENLPARKFPWTVLCNWRFDALDSAVAEEYGTAGTACVLRPE